MFSNVAFYKTGNKEIKREKFKPFEKKVWLSSPTMHGDEMKFIREAYETNWMSTIGANINAVMSNLLIVIIINYYYYYLRRH